MVLLVVGGLYTMIGSMPNLSRPWRIAIIISVVLFMFLVMRELDFGNTRAIQDIPIPQTSE